MEPCAIECHTKWVRNVKQRVRHETNQDKSNEDVENGRDSKPNPLSTLAK